MKIRLLCFAMSNLLSFSGSCQQITKDDIIGIWDAITTNPNSPNVSIQFIDSFFVLTVGAQKGKSLYRLDDSSIPFILTTYESGSTNKLDYEIKFSGKDTLVFITIKGVDQKTLEHYEPPTLVRRKSELKNISRDAQNKHQNTEADFSPDGKQIVFISTRDGNREVYLMHKDGSNLRRLTNTLATESNPIFSPDGSKILFESTRDGVSQIYTMNRDGSGQINISKSNVNEYAASWSPRGDKIVFQSLRDNTSQIYTMNSDGSNPIRITSNLEYNNSFPKWSPDGNRVICSTIHPPETYKNTIIYLTKDSSVLLDPENDQRYSSLCFSPDNKNILCSSSTRLNYRETLTDLYFFNEESGMFKKIKKNIPNFNDAIFLNADSILVCTKENLNIIDINSGKMKRIYKDVRRMNYSKNENKIVFVLYASFNSIPPESDICTISVDGSGFKNLTKK